MNTITYSGSAYDRAAERLIALREGMNLADAEAFIREHAPLGEVNCAAFVDGQSLDGLYDAMIATRQLAAWCAGAHSTGPVCHAHEVEDRIARLRSIEPAFAAAPARMGV